MKGKVTPRVSAVVGLLVVVLAGAALALARAGSSPAIIINWKPAPLGLLGMTEGQTLRISIANVVGFDPQPDPPGVCTLKVGFVDRENRGYGIPDTFELRPGVARSFDFVAAGDGSVRHYVRPVVAELVDKEDCPAVISGEVLDRGVLNGIIVYDSVAFSDPWLAR
jgi:hypothetical protein